MTDKKKVAAVILGALMEGLENLKRYESYKTLFHSKGEAGFMRFEQK